MRQLGKALGIIVRAEAREHFMHDDISAWGAPSECHGAVSKGEASRMRQAFRHAKAVSGVSASYLRREVRKLGQPRWEKLLSRVYDDHYSY